MISLYASKFPPDENNEITCGLMGEDPQKLCSSPTWEHAWQIAVEMRKNSLWPKDTLPVGFDECNPGDPYHFGDEMYELLGEDGEW